MPATRQPGMDHDHYDWSPISTRPPLRWPDGAHVALCVIVNLEHFEWTPPAESYYPPRPFADTGHRDFSHHEYGHRVGIFNVMEVLDRLGIRATVAMDAITAENYPFIVQECLKRQWELIGHGISMRRLITSNMTEERERQYIRSSIAALENATGVRPTGWFGQEYSESTRTPALLAEQGIRYLCDWPNDEQPYPMNGHGHEIYSLPVALELEDVYALGTPRYVPIADYCQMLQDAFDVLHMDGGQTGRLLVLSLHPYLIGQPFRVKYLEQTLAYMCRHSGVWKATGREIIDWYAGQTAH